MAAICNEFESLDEEVKELLKNYKHKKATTYEPCTRNNVVECLIGLSEEFGLFNISYVFNPHIDVENNTLRPEALKNLINSTWTLLHHHKNSTEKAESLAEQNHILEHNNKQLNGIVNRLKEKLNSEKNEAKACVASAQRVADRSDDLFHKLAEAQAKLTQLTKKKDTSEKSLRNEIARLKLSNEKLLDKLRNKSDTHTSCSDVCDSTLLQLKERDRKQRAFIAKIQANNQELLHELLHMKEKFILEGLHDFKLEDRKK